MTARNTATGEPTGELRSLVDVLPPPGARRPRRWTRLLRAPQAALGTAALLLLGAPFAAVWLLGADQPEHRAGAATTDRQEALTAQIDPAALTRWRQSGRDLPAVAPPVVLAYHDVQPTASDRYTVTPQQLDVQLTALDAAGYQTITSQQYAAYVQGAPAPPRSVYITFDDGAGGLWTYADPIMARHHAHGAVFLISGRVGTHSPYYLTWAEVTKMAGSGRWDFQAHTHDLHSHLPISASGTLASALTNQLWIEARHRLETLDEYQERVVADTNELFTDFQSHDLPRPVLAAYPFSEATDPSKDQTAVRFVSTLFSQRFVATLTNKVPTPAPSSRRSAAGKLIARIEVTAGTSPDVVLEKVISWTSLTVDGERPLDHPDRWRDWDGNALPSLAVFTGLGSPATVKSGNGYTYAVYAPCASADWNDYRVTMTLGGLVTNRPGVNLFVRVGGSSALVFRFSRSTVEAGRGTRGDPTLGRAALRPAKTHRVQITVSDRVTSVAVDGVTLRRVPNSGAPSSTGGIALAVRQGDPVLDRPVVTGMVLATTAGR